MRIYFAARYSRFSEMLEYKWMVETLGHKVTSRWIHGGPHLTDDELNSNAVEHRLIAERTALNDLKDLQDADCCISFTEAPRLVASRGGRHVELGWALGRGRICLVIGPAENVFHRLPGIRRFGTMQEALMSMPLYDKRGRRSDRHLSQEETTVIQRVEKKP